MIMKMITLTLMHSEWPKHGVLAILSAKELITMNVTPEKGDLLIILRIFLPPSSEQYPPPPPLNRTSYGGSMEILQYFSGREQKIYRDPPPPPPTQQNFLWRQFYWEFTIYFMKRAENLQGHLSMGYKQDLSPDRIAPLSAPCPSHKNL